MLTRYALPTSVLSVSKNRGPTQQELFVRWGNKIRSLRAADGRTQADLAEAVGIGQRALSQIERGLYGGSDTTRLAISRALGVPVHNLFDYPDEAAAS